MSKTDSRAPMLGTLALANILGVFSGAASPTPTLKSAPTQLSGVEEKLYSCVAGKFFRDGYDYRMIMFSADPKNPLGKYSLNLVFENYSMQITSDADPSVQEINPTPSMIKVTHIPDRVTADKIAREADAKVHECADALHNQR